MTPEITAYHNQIQALSLRVNELELALAASLAQNVKLLVRVEELERRLALNSQNSSKPPSSDGLKKPAPQSLREKSGKPAGGQVGHKGGTLKQVLQPDEIIIHALGRCPNCTTNLEHSAVIGTRLRQVFDIPEPRVQVTEHQAQLKYCPCCSAQVCADFPPDVQAPVQYGARVKALSVYLHQQQMIPEDRLAMLFQDVFALPISATCLANYSTDFAEKIQPLLAVIAEQLRTAEVKHVDESGLRVAAKLHWTHVLSDSYWTYYRVSEKRGDVPQNLIGILIHDHFKSYYKLTGVTHGLCGAHHLRELKGLATIEKESWAKDMFALLQSACHQVNQGLIAPLSAAQIERDYDCIVKQGVIFHEQQTPLQQALKGRKKRRTGHNLVLRLRDYKDDALRFLYHANVPFTNNQAEQDVRMIKVKQKISGGFRTLEGAQAFAATRSYLSTMRKQCVNLFEAIMSPCHTNFTRYSG